MSNKKFRWAIKTNIGNFIARIKENKVFILVCTGFAILGLIFAISQIQSISDECCNIILLIKNQEFSIIAFEFKLIVYPIILAIIPILLSVNFYIFLLSFIEISIASYIFFKYLLNTIICHIGLGFLSAILILLPIAVWIFFGLALLLSQIYCLINNTPCKKRIYVQPVCFHFRSLKKIFIEFLLLFLLPVFIYANFVLILIYLII